MSDFYELLQRAKSPTPIQDSVKSVLDEPSKYRNILDHKKENDSSNIKPLSPFFTSLAGGLLDTGSTYSFLKRGTKTESNSLINKLSPSTMAGLGLGANIAIPYILKKLGGKYPTIARAIAANQGGLQLGYGVSNFGDDARDSSDVYDNSIFGNIDKGILEQQGRLKR